MASRRVNVFGPAYLDRVLRVGEPLVEGSSGPPIDQSSDGTWRFAPTSTGKIEVIDPAGSTLDDRRARRLAGPDGRNSPDPNHPGACPRTAVGARA